MGNFLVGLVAVPPRSDNSTPTRWPVYPPVPFSEPVPPPPPCSATLLVCRRSGGGGSDMLIFLFACHLVSRFQSPPPCIYFPSIVVWTIDPHMPTCTHPLPPPQLAALQVPRLIVFFCPLGRRFLAVHRDRWFCVMSYLLHHIVSPRALHGGWGLPQSPWVLQTVMDGES